MQMIAAPVKPSTVDAEIQSNIEPKEEQDQEIQVAFTQEP